MKISQPLARVGQIKRLAFQNGAIENNLDVELYITRKDIEYEYAQDPNSENLFAMGQYGLALCGIYLFAAQQVSGDGGDLATITPATGSGDRELIRITGANFADATNWNGNNNDGISILSSMPLQIMWNGIRWLTENVEWTRTSQGIQILIAGFDATGANLTDEFYVDISNNSSSSTVVSGGGSLVTSYPVVGGETSFVLAGLVGKSVSMIIYGTPYELIFSGTPTISQVKFTSSTGTVEFNSGNPLVAGQSVWILYS